jgi:hypothetical protein
MTERRSERTGRLLCPCGKGYANEQHDSAHYGVCKVCYCNGLTRRELRALWLKRL